MKKIIKTLLICCAIILGISIGFFGYSQHRTDVTITDLIQTADADAECGGYNGWLYGRCLSLSGVCVFDTSATQCSP